MSHHRTAALRASTALVAGLVVAALCLTPAVGQVPGAGLLPDQLPSGAGTDDRLDRIERQIESLVNKESQSQANSGAPPTFQMGGQVQVDTLLIGQNAANRASVGDAENVFDFRRARLVARGEAAEVVEYAIGFDFALPGRPSFLDNFVGVTDLPVLGNVRAGQFFEPFSLERYTVVRYTTFMERSLADAFAPARNLGIMAHNTLGELQRGTWAAGWFRSNSDDFGESFGDVGGNAVTTRVTWLPLYNLDTGGRSFVHVGAAYTFRSADHRLVQFASFPEARAGAPGPAGIPPFVDTGMIPANSDQRVGLEAALVAGPLYVQGEYITAAVDQLGGPGLRFQGGYAFVSYFLTGENRTYNKQLGTIDRVYPYENFLRVRTADGLATGSGAWEVAARWSFIDLDSRNVQGGTLHDFTFALNWHLNPYTRVKWEYIYASLNRAPIGDSFAQIAGMRFDIDF